MFSYRIDSENTMPIYMQIAKSIEHDIKKEILKNGDKLPTVRELADELGVACGTIKRTYDELKKTGLITMTQGRGTFVSFGKQNNDSRKEQAMTAIDDMLDKLENLSFSTKEIQIFIDLKIRERIERNYDVQIAVVDCNSEVLESIVKQIYHIQGINVYKILLEDIEKKPYNIEDKFDIVITTLKHYDIVQELFTENENIVKIALNTSQKTVMELAQLKQEDNVAVITKSHSFMNIVNYAINLFNNECKNIGYYIIQNNDDNYVKNILVNKNIIILPANYEKLFSKSILNVLNSFSINGRIIEYEYAIDHGSLMYIEEKIGSIQKRKRKPDKK